MRIHIRLIVIIVLISFSSAIKAHVKLNDSLGGEILLLNELVTISWIEEIPHNTYNWDLLLSQDGGMTWDTIQADIPKEARSYEWQVPDIQTENGRVKIVQDNEIMDYEDISERFTVGEVTTSLYNLAESSSSFVSSFVHFPNPFSDQLNLEFDLTKTANVNLNIYDSSGQQMLSLENTVLHPQKHSFVWRTKGWTDGLYVMQLRIENAILVRPLIHLRE